MRLKIIEKLVFYVLCSFNNYVNTADYKDYYKYKLILEIHSL